MDKTIVKQCVRLIGGIAVLCLGGGLIYKAGCQKGVIISEWIVNKYEPEAYERLCKIVTKHKGNES